MHARQDHSSERLHCREGKLKPVTAIRAVVHRVRNVEPQHCRFKASDAEPQPDSKVGLGMTESASDRLPAIDEGCRAGLEEVEKLAAEENAVLGV